MFGRPSRGWFHRKATVRYLATILLLKFMSAKKAVGTRLGLGFMPQVG